MMVSEGLWKEQFLLSGQCGEQEFWKEGWGTPPILSDWNREARYFDIHTIANKVFQFFF